jgi:meiotically up-regulated gene 157 (Mug157) protein
MKRFSSASYSAGTNSSRLKNLVILVLAAIIVLGFLVETQRAADSIHFLHLQNDDASNFNNNNPSTYKSNLDNASLDSPLPYPQEIWAGGYDILPSRTILVDQIRQRLSPANVSDLASLCGRGLYDSLTHSVTAHGLDDWVFVSTGDIKEMWIRDSAVQMAIYLKRMHRRPAVRRLLEGTIRTQAYYTIQDPYGNSFYDKWKSVDSITKQERRLGRGGWTGTRNYELDSGAYFLHFLWNYYASGIYGPEKLVSDPLIYDAVSILVDTWTIEQHHEELSTYRYTELDRDGIGSKTGYTGMTWTGFRPSDDPTNYGYSIPSNIYAAGALERVLELNKRIWRNKDLETRSLKLLQGIESGIREYGIVKAENGVKIYAYEVDGLGGKETQMDDANIPSLLSIPLLGWSGWDPEVYAATRKRLFNNETSDFYFAGEELEGLGSPHTAHGMVWALAVVTRALTAPALSMKMMSGTAAGGTTTSYRGGLTGTSDVYDKDTVTEIVRQLEYLLKMQCGTGSMHESVHVDNLSACSRPVFHWADAAAVTAIEALLDIDCDKEAEQVRLQDIVERERTEKLPEDFFVEEEEGGDGGGSGEKQKGYVENPLFYETLEAHVSRDTPSNALVEDLPQEFDGQDMEGVHHHS